MLTRSKIPSVKKLLPGETLRPEPRSDDEGDSDDDGHGNLKGFVVYEKSTEKPHDHAQVDKMWSACKPRTRGQAKLNKVIEKYSK